MIEMPIAWLLGDGVRLTAEDARARAWLEEFWRDPVTDMPRNLPRMMREFALFGEHAAGFRGTPIRGMCASAISTPRRIADVVFGPRQRGARGGGGDGARRARAGAPLPASSWRGRKRLSRRRRGGCGKA